MIMSAATANAAAGAGVGAGSGARAHATAAAAAAEAEADNDDDETFYGKIHRLATVGRGTRLTSYTKHLFKLASDPNADYVQEASFNRGVQGNPYTELSRVYNLIQRLRDPSEVNTMNAMGREDLRVIFTSDSKGVLTVSVDDVLFPSFNLRLEVYAATKVVKLLHVSNPVPGLEPIKLHAVCVTWETCTKGKSPNPDLCIRDPCTGFDIVIVGISSFF